MVKGPTSHHYGPAALSTTTPSPLTLLLLKFILNVQTPDKTTGDVIYGWPLPVDLLGLASQNNMVVASRSNSK